MREMFQRQQLGRRLINVYMLKLGRFAALKQMSGQTVLLGLQSITSR